MAYTFGRRSVEVETGRRYWTFRILVPVPEPARRQMFVVCPEHRGDRAEVVAPGGVGQLPGALQAGGLTEVIDGIADPCQVQVCQVERCDADQCVRHSARFRGHDAAELGGDDEVGPVGP